MTFLNPYSSLAIMMITLSLIGCVRDAAESLSSKQDRESYAIPEVSPQQACECSEPSNQCRISEMSLTGLYLPKVL